MERNLWAKLITSSATRQQMINYGTNWKNKKIEHTAANSFYENISDIRNPHTLISDN